MTWITEQAITLCRLVEEIAPKHGFHVALTGGTLYKTGARKDLDILFYRIRQVEKPNHDELFNDLKSIGLKKKSGFGWCHKCEFMGKPVDVFFPEEPDGGEYRQ